MTIMNGCISISNDRYIGVTSSTNKWGLFHLSITIIHLDLSMEKMGHHTGFYARKSSLLGSPRSGTNYRTWSCPPVHLSGSNSPLSLHLLPLGITPAQHDCVIQFCVVSPRQHPWRWLTIISYVSRHVRLWCLIFLIRVNFSYLRENTICYDLWYTKERIFF
jgi:hypothetical protein